MPIRRISGPLTDSEIMKYRVVVLTETPLREQMRISEVTRANDIALVIADSRGVYSQVFCDFGANFTTFDPKGEPAVSAMVADVTNETHGIVTCLDESRHGMETGDYVSFSEVEGMTELNQLEPQEIKVLGPYTFSIGDTTNLSKYERGGVATQVLMPVNINFKSLNESLRQPEFLITDFSKMDYPDQLHLCFIGLHNYVEQNGRYPRPRNPEDAEAFLGCVKRAKEEFGFSTEINEELAKEFAMCSAGSLNPINATVGGIAAQEVMKACGQKFTPIKQWLYFDAIEVLPPNRAELTEQECAPTGSRYDGQIAVLGRTFQEKLGDLKYFVVGAGAIGCELLKNFAMMGVGARNGCITVTDMDLIERSNLNRQFLFRPSDVQKPKSSTAARVIKGMNPEVTVVAHENRVGTETERIYDDEFFEALDGVANALDNVDARIYMDRRCVFYRKPLLESGTLGTKGNTQVMIPIIIIIILP